MVVAHLMATTSGPLSGRQNCRDAINRIAQERTEAWPVVDTGGKFLGLVTLESLINATLTRGLEPEDVLCQEALLPDPVVIRDSLSLAEAWAKPFSLAAVSDGSNRIVGIISRNKLALALYQDAQFKLRQLELVLNSAHNGIVVINAEGIITSFNSAAEFFTGVPCCKAIGRHILDVLLPIGMIEILHSGKSEYAQKFKVGRRTYIMNRDPVIQDGKIIGAVGVFQDISEIELISAELASVKELNRELNSIIQSSADGFFITNTAGTILRVNHAFEVMSQYSAQELIGKKMQQFVEQGIFAHHLVDLVLQRKQPVTVMENKHDNSLLITGSPVLDEQGEIVRVVVNLRNMTSLNQLRQELMDAKRLSQQYHLELSELRSRQSTCIIGSSREMERVLELAVRVAKVDSTVLLRGESGAGKEMIAQLLHSTSQRVDGPFIKLNCGAIPEQLLESELFGYQSGAFTGARREGKPGMFELAHNGTIFLDEVGDLPLSLQAKLLRVLQEKEFVPLGGVRPKQVDVRILAATHQDLESMVTDGQFREDLFFRLNVVPIWIPPLRQRGKDIIELVYHFKDKFSKKYGIVREFLPEVIEAFLNYSWPGNVRELENMVERLMVVAQGEQIALAHLPANIRQTQCEERGLSVHSLMPLKVAVALVEQQLIGKAMLECGSTYKAAKVLEVNQSTVVRRMAKFRGSMARVSS